MPRPTGYSPRRILVVQPSWVGDAVMATPTLRAIRLLYPAAHITYLLRRYVKPLYAGMPWADRLITYRTARTGPRRGRGMLDIVRRIRAGRFDLAILLTNSFKTALMCWLGGASRRVGYDRDGRGLLLTDRLPPFRQNGRLAPTPIIHTYLDLARHLGSKHDDLKMELFVTPRELRQADDVWRRCGLDQNAITGVLPENGSARPASASDGGDRGIGPPRVLLNPGANYGAAKCWPIDYFAQLADRLIDQRRATILISAAPKERRIVDGILSRMHHPAIDLSDKGTTLGSLKEIVRRCDLMITNDTGPRHIAAAMNVPVVTLFGPTFPQWTEIYFPRERQLAIKVPCGPCQLKTCPLDHRCMNELTPAMAFAAAIALLDGAVALPVV